MRRVRDRDDKLVAEGFADAAEALTRRLRGREAPAACVEAVRNAITMPFDEGLKREAELFRKLVAGDQSKAQRHIFFAEREAAKVPDMPEATRQRQITRGAVIGVNELTLFLSSAVSPQELGLSGDTRRLSIAVDRLMVRTP